MTLPGAISFHAFIRHEDIPLAEAKGWVFDCDLGPTHGLWSTMMRWAGPGEPSHHPRKDLPMTLAEIATMQTAEIKALHAKVDRLETEMARRDDENTAKFNFLFTRHANNTNRRLDDHKAEIDALRSSGKFHWSETKDHASGLGDVSGLAVLAQELAGLRGDRADPAPKPSASSIALNEHDLVRIAREVDPEHDAAEASLDKGLPAAPGLSLVAAE